MTRKQKKLARIMGKNGSIKEDMLEAGYALSTAEKQPKTVTKAKGWKELLDAYLPDDKLLKAHDEALNAVKIVTSHTEPDSVLPDHAIRLKATELGYKVKGKMSESTTNIQINVQPILGEMKAE